MFLQDVLNGITIFIIVLRVIGPTFLQDIITVSVILNLIRLDLMLM